MEKLIKNREESRAKILNAVRLITEPVVQTLSPLGANVLYQDSNGGYNLTNDGVTIARQISSSDPIEDAIIEVIKHGALKTNKIAGDGTTTTTLFTSILINEGMKMLDDGWNPMILKQHIQDIGNTIVESLVPIKIKNDSELLSIAKISANNDDVIAKNVLDIVKTAGENGMVIIQDSNKEETVVEKNSGFIVSGGIFSPEYAGTNGYTNTLDDCHVLICDKRLYYEDEANAIVRVAIENGIKNLVIVARDYIGKAPMAFSANQLQNESINIVLLKDTNATETNTISLTDLGVYLKGKVVTEALGKLTNNLTVEYFSKAKSLFANPTMAVIQTAHPDDKELISRIKDLQVRKEEDQDDKEVNRRLSALTNGMVTVKVGGNTPIETQEKIFRYEDAVNATRAAMKDGYLVGGGMGILAAYKPELFSKDSSNLAKKLCESSIRQIAKNCGKHEDHVLSQVKPYIGFGYNAKKDKYEDLLKAGIIDPYKVTEMAVKNAVSIASSILSAQWIVVYEKEDKENK